MKKILLLILVTFVAGNAFGQELGRYIGASTGASGVNPKVTFSGLTRGSGVKRELDAEYFASTEWNSSDMNAAKAANEYGKSCKDV
ncbi:MAG: hypothetical protein EOP54_31570 [Sphingobacteriales bacterium]|nr:MAG: hypothetical protein EOP54_31570 [Sphingobacteriales bacterium]